MRKRRGWRGPRTIGLFRYMLIAGATDPALSVRQRGAMVRGIAGTVHAGPGGAGRAGVA